MSKFEMGSHLALNESSRRKPKQPPRRKKNNKDLGKFGEGETITYRERVLIKPFTQNNQEEADLVEKEQSIFTKTKVELEQIVKAEESVFRNQLKRAPVQRIAQSSEEVGFTRDAILRKLLAPLPQKPKGTNIVKPKRNPTSTDLSVYYEGNNLKLNVCQSKCRSLVLEMRDLNTHYPRLLSIRPSD